MARVLANTIGLVDQKSVAAGWIKFDNDAVVDDKFGVCDNAVHLGASLWRIDFSSPMANTDYGIWATNDDLASGASAGAYVVRAQKFTTSCQIRMTHHPSNTAINHNHLSVLIFGVKA